jgi:hypothetical protein
VLVHLGSSDFLQRYQIYVSHAQAWRQQFQKLESVDLRYDNQIIVNPDMERPSPGTPKTVPLKAVAAKKDAVVKPAALLTRIGPHERVVPKPAFELTEKKIDPKPGSDKPGPKKAAKPRAQRAAASASQRTASHASGRHAISKQKSATKGQLSAGVTPPKPAVMGKQPVASTASMTAKPSGGQKPSAGILKNQAGAASTD